MKKAPIAIILLFSSLLLSAQVVVNAVLTPDEIQIGEQATLRFELSHTPTDAVEWPLYSDTIASSIEILEIGKSDTVDLDNNRIQVNKDYLITCFDSGFYLIPSASFAYGTDTLFTKAIGLSVHTPEVNPDVDPLTDIKEIMDAPFSWKELLKWLGLVLAILLLIAGVVFVLMRYVFKKKIPFLPEEKEEVIPSHILALERLQKVKDEKLWQKGNTKGFYTEITDVLREYLEGRFGINALEMTSDEVLTIARKEADLKEVVDALRQVLELGDLVKFAKFMPIENENDRAIMYAFQLVEKTKKEEVEEASTSEIIEEK